MQGKDREIFFGLDALRGYAAVSVLLFHCSDMFGTPWFFRSGHLAVDLFFTMSGFVIAHSYEKSIRERGLVWFAQVRLIRFLPLYVLGGLFGLIRVVALFVVGSDTEGWLSATVAYFAFLPAPETPFSGDSISPLNGPAWSLLFELYVNIAFAVTLPALTDRRLLIFLAATGGALAVLALTGQDLAGARPSEFGLGFLRSSFSIGLGVTLYRFRERLPRFKLHPAVLCALTLAVFQMPQSIAVHICFVLIISPLIVVAGISTGNEGWASRFGASSSFAIYALHQPLLSLADGFANKAGLPPAICAAVVATACVLLAPAVDRYYDRPLHRLLKSTIKRRTIIV